MARPANTSQLPCFRCGYDLAGLGETTSCPECGLEGKEARSLGVLAAKRRRNGARWCVICADSIGVVVLLGAAAASTRLLATHPAARPLPSIELLGLFAIDLVITPLLLILLSEFLMVSARRAGTPIGRVGRLSFRVVAAMWGVRLILLMTEAAGSLPLRGSPGWLGPAMDIALEVVEFGMPLVLVIAAALVVRSTVSLGRSARRSLLDLGIAMLVACVLLSIAAITNMRLAPKSYDVRVVLVPLLWLTPVSLFIVGVLSMGLAHAWWRRFNTAAS